MYGSFQTLDVELRKVIFMKIINLHGFLGAADNKNYKSLCGMFPKEDIISPQLPYTDETPENIIAMISELVQGDDDIFVGQSLGGWYADKLSRKFSRPCVLTNPCYYPHKLDLIRDTVISAEITEQYERLSENTKNPLAYTVCSDADTLIVGNYANCQRLSFKIISANGDHSNIKNRDALLKECFAEIIK